MFNLGHTPRLPNSLPSCVREPCKMPSISGSMDANFRPTSIDTATSVCKANERTKSAP